MTDQEKKYLLGAAAILLMLRSKKGGDASLPSSDESEDGGSSAPSPQGRRPAKKRGKGTPSLPKGGDASASEIAARQSAVRELRTMFRNEEESSDAAASTARGIYGAQGGTNTAFDDLLAQFGALHIGFLPLEDELEGSVRNARVIIDGIDKGTIINQEKIKQLQAKQAKMSSPPQNPDAALTADQAQALRSYTEVSEQIAALQKLIASDQAKRKAVVEALAQVEIQLERRQQAKELLRKINQMAGL